MNTAIEHLKKDKVLAALLETLVPKNTLASTESKKDIYFALLESIVSQQLSVKASDTIFKRFLLLFESGYPDAGQLVKMPVELLRSAGLSYQKASYLQNVASFSLQNDIGYEQLCLLPDEDIIAMLTKIKGVGQWTVEMLLMFVLDRPDVFPYDDLIVRNNIIKLYGIEAQGKELKSRVMAVAAQWRPHRTTACKHLWRWKDEGFQAKGS